MKRLLSVVLMICLLTSALYVTAEEGERELRAVWFSYEDYSAQLAGLTQREFEAKADAICENIKSSGLNTLIFHVRAFSDAFYDSDLFGYSRYVCGEAGVSPEYDPLALMCEIAHKNGLDIHAWINPYRIGAPENVTPDSVAHLWRQQYGDERVCEHEGAWYYNPADEHVRQYIIQGVREVVEGYPVDGIHFDDYFYPTAGESFDAAAYAASATTLTLNQWRLENVDLLILQTYDSIKEINPDVLFGVSPNADIEKNMTQYFANVEKWGSCEGYVDYLAPQIYFGYENSTMPFDKVLYRWVDLCTVPDLYIGLAAYKAGKEDKWAGEGRLEWVNGSGIIATQIADVRENPDCDGFMLFCYSPFYSDTSSAEHTAVKALLTGSEPEQLSPLDAFIDLLKAIFVIF